MTSARGNLGGNGHIWGQSGNATLAPTVASKCIGTAITAEIDGVGIACSNLNVVHTDVQGRDVALVIVILTASNDIAITSEKHTMSKAGSNLGVSHTHIQRWDITLIP